MSEQKNQLSREKIPFRNGQHFFFSRTFIFFDFHVFRQKTSSHQNLSPRKKGLLSVDGRIVSPKKMGWPSFRALEVWCKKISHPDSATSVAFVRFFGFWKIHH